MPKGQMAPDPCPECGGKMWDNSDIKKGKAPDYKCKDKNCDGAVWLDSAARKKAGTPAAAAAAKQGNGRPTNGDRYPVFALYTGCVKHATAEFAAACREAKVEPTAEALAAQVATLFIQSCQSRGPLTAKDAERAKAAAAERKKKAEEEARARAEAERLEHEQRVRAGEFADFPSALEDTDDDLPF